MEKITVALLGVIVVAILLTWISVAYAETYDVEISDTGFSPNNGTMNINHGDNITFIVSDGVGHELSNPWLGGENFLNNDNPSITHSFTECSSYTFTLDFHVDQLDVAVENCPPPVVVDVVPTNSTSTTVVVGTVDASDPVVDDETFAEEIAKEEEDKRVSATNETLGFRLQILQVLENILSILFGE
jgi:plastocyanin